MFIFKIETDNDAFREDDTAEIARLLREAADKLEEGQTARGVKDLNGNRVGQWEYTPSDLDG